MVIENPIINSPFAEPTRHFKFTDDPFAWWWRDIFRQPARYAQKTAVAVILDAIQWGAQDTLEELEGMIQKKLETYRKPYELLQKAV